jgi:hypothetical protein
MRIHAVNAAEGDCLLLENNGAFALVDGGIAGNYAANLQPYLKQEVGVGGHLEVVLVSHVDADHITGIIDLLADIERARADDEPVDPVIVGDLWHNSFGTTLDTANGALFANLQAMMSQAGRAAFAAANGSVALLGIAQGARLQRKAAQLGIPLNGFFGGKRLTQEEMVGQTWSLGSADFVVVGPRPQISKICRTIGSNGSSATWMLSRSATLRPWPTPTRACRTSAASCSSVRRRMEMFSSPAMRAAITFFRDWNRLA